MLMDRTASSSKVVVSSQVTVAVREELERRALEADRTISWLVRDAVASYLGEKPRASSASVAGVS